MEDSIGIVSPLMEDSIAVCIVLDISSVKAVMDAFIVLVDKALLDLAMVTVRRLIALKVLHSSWKSSNENSENSNEKVNNESSK